MKKTQSKLCVFFMLQWFFALFILIAPTVYNAGGTKPNNKEKKEKDPPPMIERISPSTQSAATIIPQVM